MEPELKLRPAVMAAINRQQSLLYLTLILGHEIFAWDGLEVRDIVRCDAMAEMSDMPPFICGGVFWNGEAVPVVDLQARTSRKPTPITKCTRVVIVEMAQSGTRQLLGIVMNPLAALHSEPLRGTAHLHKAIGIPKIPNPVGDPVVPRRPPAVGATRKSRVLPQRCTV